MTPEEKLREVEVMEKECVAACRRWIRLRRSSSACANAEAMGAFFAEMISAARRADREKLREAEAELARALEFLKRSSYADKEIVSTCRLSEQNIANYRAAGLMYVEPGGGLGWVVRESDRFVACSEQLHARAEKAEAECERLKAERDEAIVNGPRQFNEGHRTGRDQAEETAREEIERVRAAFPHTCHATARITRGPGIVSYGCNGCKIEAALEGK